MEKVVVAMCTCEFLKFFGLLFFFFCILLNRNIMQKRLKIRKIFGRKVMILFCRCNKREFDVYRDYKNIERWNIYIFVLEWLIWIIILREYQSNIKRRGSLYRDFSFCFPFSETILYSRLQIKYKYSIHVCKY